MRRPSARAMFAARSGIDCQSVALTWSSRSPTEPIPLTCPVPSKMGTFARTERPSVARPIPTHAWPASEMTSTTAAPECLRPGRRRDSVRAMGGPAIELRHVSKRFLTPSGTAYTALRDLDLVVHDGEFCAVVGPTGCGKSTTLALISGLEPASDGDVLVHGERVQGIAREVGYVFQVDAVFPWQHVLDNVAPGPRFRGAARREAERRARDWIARVGLGGFERYYPHQ